MITFDLLIDDKRCIRAVKQCNYAERLEEITTREHRRHGKLSAVLDRVLVSLQDSGPFGELTGKV